MNFIQRMIQGLRRQWIIIDAIATYDRDRQASGSSLGSWESLINPLQMMVFFIGMRIGFSYLRGSSKFAGGGTMLPERAYHLKTAQAKYQEV